MIYFIQQGEKGPIKIGWANDPKKRLQSLQVGSAFDLSLLGVIKSDDRNREKTIQRQFAENRIRGEWYSPSEFLLDFIKRASSNRQTSDWDILCEAESRLLDLYNEARSIKDNRRNNFFCANRIWYGIEDDYGLRGKLINLVGWVSQKNNPILKTTEAYDIAYDKVYNALPNCRNCLCWGGEGWE